MNSYRMLGKTRSDLIDVATRQGWGVKTKDGSDLYKKLICLEKNGISLFVDKSIGISKSGKVTYLKIYVHPEQYVKPEDLPSKCVEPCINRMTKKNLHSHSGLQGFPYFDGKGEPCGKAYKLTDQSAWEKFLNDFYRHR